MVEALAAHPFLLIDTERLGRVVLHSEVRKQEYTSMPGSKRVLCDSSSDDEIVVFTLGKKTLKNFPTFLHAYSVPFHQHMDGQAIEDDMSEAETFLLGELCTKPGTFDEDKIMRLLKDEANHLPVMEALAFLLNYDINLDDVTDGFDEADTAEIKRINALLPRWAEIAKKERARLSKKANSA